MYEFHSMCERHLGVSGGNCRSLWAKSSLQVSRITLVEKAGRTTNDTLKIWLYLAHKVTVLIFLKIMSCKVGKMSLKIQFLWLQDFFFFWYALKSSTPHMVPQFYWKLKIRYFLNDLWHKNIWFLSWANDMCLDLSLPDVSSISLEQWLP